MRSSIANKFLTLTLLLPLSTRALIPPPALVQAGIGAAAGSAGALASYPIDYVKAQLQTEAGRAKYSSGMDAALSIIKKHATPLALYRGAAVQVVGAAPEKTVKLGVNNAMRVAIQAQLGYLPLMGEVIAGGLAGMLQVIVTNPTEIVKVKLQTSNKKFKDIVKEIQDFAGLYEGAGACAVRDAIFSAVLFPSYAHASGFLHEFVSPDASVQMFLANLLAGSLAAGPAAIVATPADVIKTRIQQVAGASEEQETSFIGVGARIIQTEGSQVLFSGWLERAVRSVPQLGVTLAVFEVLSSMATTHGLLSGS